jgi:hypothetical protein
MMRVPTQQKGEEDVHPVAIRRLQMRLFGSKSSLLARNSWRVIRRQKDVASRLDDLNQEEILEQRTPWEDFRRAGLCKDS